MKKSDAFLRKPDHIHENREQEAFSPDAPATPLDAKRFWRKRFRGKKKPRARVIPVVMVVMAMLFVTYAAALVIFILPVEFGVSLLACLLLAVLAMRRRPAGAALYLLVIVSAFMIFIGILETGAPVAIASWCAAFWGGACVVITEQILPHRASWRPTRADLATDISYLALAQIALPALLMAGILHLAFRLDFPSLAIWPHKLPLIAQIVMMLLLADFARYWMHRACHATPVLWRFHAVHHAPEQLYALNVGRFHPVEKTLQLLLDTVPFALLGVSETVVGAYLVFYATHGFFQHSNITLRLGWLNFIVSGPELHRWHHARAPKISGHNFGNNLIIWDLLFGTRLLPDDAEVKTLGLLDRSYPRDFPRQMIAPFMKRHEGAEGTEGTKGAKGAKI